jgi:hypothetical protein
MLPKEIKERLEDEIRNVEHPRELAVDVMFAIQDHYGYLSDEALAEAAAMLGLEALAEVVGRGEGERVLVAPDAPLAHLPAARLSADQARRIGQGQAVAMALPPADPVRLYGPDGGFVGLGRADPEGRLHARRLFVPAPDGSGA